MRTIGLTNPIPIILGLFPLYLFYSFVQHMGQNLFSGEIGYYFFLVFMFIMYVIGPILLLTFLRLIIIFGDRIIEIYIFRLTKKTYFTKDLKSTFTQKMAGNSRFPFDFYQTYLYFGQEKRIRFSALEFINYRALKTRLENIEKKAAKKL